MNTVKTPWSMWLLRMQIILVALIPLFIIGYRAGWLDVKSGFLSASFSILAAAAFALVGAFVLLWALGRGNRAPGAGWTVVLGALPLLAMGNLILSGGLSVPPIHDISTDVIDPPAYKRVLELRIKGDHSLVYGGPKLAAQQQQAYADVKTIETEFTLPAAHAKALAAVQELGWEVVADNKEAGHIEAVISSAVFGFKDDVVIRSRVGEQGVIVDLRSASRLGLSDLGANAKRIRAFIEVFNQP